MSLYRRGSVGPEVSRIQSRLQELDLYRGPVDAALYQCGEGEHIRARRITRRYVAQQRSRLWQSRR
jgi:hypothetical protein